MTTPTAGIHDFTVILCSFAVGETMIARATHRNTEDPVTDRPVMRLPM
jgi:hypothetical protein